jgi:hypothetical protein
MDLLQLQKKIFEIGSPSDFDSLALEVFRFQAAHCSVYARFLQLLGVRPGEVTEARSIPFLPIEAFRDHVVMAKDRTAETVFSSSQTTGSVPSRHHVADLSLYDRSLLEGFRLAYGDPSGYAMLALLPTYLERPDASLVYMVRRLMEHSGHPMNGFFIHEKQELVGRIRELTGAGQRLILFGVTFALMDLSEEYPFEMGENIMVETGGMKGRRKEIVREELHRILCGRFGISAVHSEYGMTEMLSQAWSKGQGIYRPVPWMRVDAVDMNDPFTSEAIGSTGLLRVTDLANLYSCSFIATQDLGRIASDGTFEVLGRADHSDVRGCNLMVV